MRHELPDSLRSVLGVPTLEKQVDQMRKLQETLDANWRRGLLGENLDGDGADSPAVALAQGGKPDVDLVADDGATGVSGHSPTVAGDVELAAHRDNARVHSDDSGSGGSAASGVAVNAVGVGLNGDRASTGGHIARSSDRLFGRFSFGARRVELCGALFEHLGEFVAQLLGRRDWGDGARGVDRFRHRNDGGSDRRGLDCDFIPRLGEADRYEACQGGKAQ